MPPGLPADEDYDALCEALMASARGRWFLQEYAKRNRNADTGIVLDAIARVEAVVRGEQAHHATQGMRIELLEMARTIAQTRADVAEAKPAPSTEAVSDSGSDIFAAAGRLQEVAWTMRERGLDMTMCDQIADLSSAILSASSLRNPNDGRAQQLGEVLRSLEQRIDAMLRAASEPPPSDGAGDRPAPEYPVATAATLPFPTVGEPEAEPVSAEPEPTSEARKLDLDPIPVELRAASTAADTAEPPAPPAPPAAPPPDAAEDFLLAPMTPPGAAPAAAKPADPLAALRTLTPHERIALFT
jgi:type II secretory pathway pseudopilin PulG